MQAKNVESQTNAPKNNAAIFYTSHDFRTSGAKLMGRNAASESFLQGLARHSNFNDFYCYAHNQETFQDFSTRVRELTAPRTPYCRWVSPDRLQSLTEPGCLFIPDPSISRFAWHRRRIHQRAYSLCGITHTISSQGSMDILGALMTAPVQAWDAVICTSNVVKASVEHMLGNMGEYYRERMGATITQPNVQLPVIPLGVNASDFDAGDKHVEYRSKWRNKLGIGENDIAFLFVGRLSFHAKAHPTPMYIALEKAAKATGKRIHLIQAGWFANDSIENSFKQGAKELCPSVNAIFLDGRQMEIRKEIWSACDIFTSLSDNIQETFGITPLEAMAAGLPVVVTDWDGYRETVRDGVDGITVPTLTPPQGTAYDLAYRFETEIDNYDMYIGNACQATSVDIEACVKAYTTLINDKALRQRMGTAGKQRVTEVYDWKHIISAYKDLWEKLSVIREEAQETAERKGMHPSNPLRDDPFTMFSTYPTTTPKTDDVITLLQGEPEEYFKKLYSLNIHRFGYLPSQEFFLKTINLLKSQPDCTIADIVNKTAPEQQAILMRVLVSFAKIGLVAIGEHNKPSR